MEMKNNFADLPETRAEAIAQGSKYYFTGEPCRHGHVDRRKVQGGCYTCWRHTVAGRNKDSGMPLRCDPVTPVEDRLQVMTGRLSSCFHEIKQLNATIAVLEAEKSTMERRIRDLEHDVVRYRDG